MFEYKFRDDIDISSFLADQLGQNHLIDRKADEDLLFFANGDTLRVYLNVRKLSWTPTSPTSPNSSILSKRIRSWIEQDIIFIDFAFSERSI